MIRPLLFALFLQPVTSLAALKACTLADGRVCRAAPNTDPGPLLLQITVSDRLDEPNALSVETTLVNKGKTTIRILDDPNSPLNPTKTHSFDFYKVPKVGARPSNESCPDAAPIDGVVWFDYKPYETATQSDRDAYIVLEPKQSKTFVSDLSEMYMFPEPGSYVIQVSKSARYFAVVADDGSVAYTQAKVADDPEALRAATVTVSKSAIDPRPNAVQEKTGSDPLADWEPQPSFRQCTTAQQRVIKTAIKATYQTLREVDDFLAAPDSFRKSRFTDWFGPASEAHWLLVRANYLTIEAKPANYRYDCSCDKCDRAAFARLSTFGKTRTITLCKSFWWAPWMGEDSKVGVLIREASRFEFLTDPQEDALKAESVNEGGTVSSAPTDFDPGAYQFFAEEAEISPESWGAYSFTRCISKFCFGRHRGSRRRRPKDRILTPSPLPVRFRVGVYAPGALVQDPTPAGRRPVIVLLPVLGPSRGPLGWRFPGPIPTPGSPRPDLGPAEGRPSVRPSQDADPTRDPRLGTSDEESRTNNKKSDQTGTPWQPGHNLALQLAGELPTGAKHGIDPVLSEALLQNTILNAISVPLGLQGVPRETWKQD